MTYATPNFSRFALLLFSTSVVVSGCSNTSDAPATKKSAPSIAPSKRKNDSAETKQAKSVDENPNGTARIHALSVETLDGKKVSLESYRGKAMLIVNTASECGYTPQYASLQKLYATYKDQGLEVLAFPSNDFGAQEPGDAAAIRTFVDDKYNIEFPMFAKVHARGKEKSPLYKTLTEDTGASIKGEVKWNFTKFLVGPDGKVRARFASKVDPMSDVVTAAVTAALPKS